MKKLAFLGFIAVSALLAQPQGPPPGGRMGFGGRGPGFGFGPGGGMRTVAGSPYSATEVSTRQQTLANGNVISQQTQTNLARDTAGRMRMESNVKRPDGTTVSRITIHDPVAGMVHNVDPQTKTVHEMTLRTPPNGGGRAGRAGARPNGARPDVTRSQRPADPNVVTEQLGVQTINGVAATGTRMTRTIPAGAEGNAQPILIVHESWFSEDLKMPVMVKTSDPRFGTTQTQLTNIVRSEPDASLFQSPAGYTVSKERGGPRGGRGPMGRGQGQ